MLAIVNAFFCAFIDNPAIGVLYSTFEKPIEGITFSQIMSVHEIFFATGRCIGLDPSYSAFKQFTDACHICLNFKLFHSHYMGIVPI